MLPQPVLTYQGLALMAKTPIGSPLELTGWKVGSGAMISGQDPASATSMIHTVYSTPISSTKNTGNVCEVLGQFANTGLPAFTWEETGLFANDPNLGEILFAYGNTFGNGEPIPAGSSGLREIVFGANLMFSNAANVTAVIDSGLIFATLSDLDRCKDEIMARIIRNDISAPLTTDSGALLLTDQGIPLEAVRFL